MSSYAFMLSALALFFCGVSSAPVDEQPISTQYFGQLPYEQFLNEENPVDVVRAKRQFDGSYASAGTNNGGFGGFGGSESQAQSENIDVGFGGVNEQISESSASSSSGGFGGFGGSESQAQSENIDVGFGGVNEQISESSASSSNGGGWK